jgi:hypothetical protein
MNDRMLKEPRPTLSKRSEEKPQQIWSQDTSLADVNLKPAEYENQCAKFNHLWQA